MLLVVALLPRTTINELMLLPSLPHTVSSLRLSLALSHVSLPDDSAGRCPPQDWETSVVIALASRLVLSSGREVSASRLGDQFGHSTGFMIGTL